MNQDTKQLAATGLPILATILIVIGAILLSMGCAAGLRGAAEDHYVQAQTIASTCGGGTLIQYDETPCSPELQDDLDAMARQAQCLLAALRGVECEEVAE